MLLINIPTINIDGKVRPSDSYDLEFDSASAKFRVNKKVVRYQDSNITVIEATDPSRVDMPSVYPGLENKGI